MYLKINFVFLLIYVLKVSTVESAEKTVGLRHILSKDDHKKLKEFVDETVNSTSDILSIPAILQPSTSPSKFLKEESTGSTHQVMIGIVIENYSKYFLADPLTSGQTDCGFNREINALPAVKPGSYEIFAVDNSKGYLERSVCGSISWQILDQSERPVTRPGQRVTYGRRLVVTYSVPYRGDCHKLSGRHNRFSVNIRDVILNGTLHWKYPDEGKKYYNTDHSDDPSDSMSWLFTQKGYDTVLGTYDNHRFAVRGHMERGCRPILKVQFFPGLATKDTMSFLVTPPPPAGLMAEPEAPKSNSPSSKIDSNSIFTIGIIVLGSVLLSLVIMSICIVTIVRRKRRNKEQFFRRPYRQ